MADVFSHADAQDLLKNKRLLFLGDSNMRAQYKDLVWLLNFNTLITEKSLKGKLEMSFIGDTLVKRSDLHRGRDFQEMRNYYDKKCRMTLDFLFIPRCYSAQIEDLFNGFKNGTSAPPDIVLMNSCLWDLTRWGPNGVPQYKDNMVKLMRLLTKCLPKKTLFIWTTALPTAAHIHGGLIIKQIEFMEPLMRFEVMEANTFAREIVVAHGFDVLDNHYYTRMQMHRRAKDGVHYKPVPVRLMTNLLLTHISLSWGNKLPNNVSSVLLDRAIALSCSKENEESSPLETSAGIFSKLNLKSPSVTKKSKVLKGLRITVDANEARPSRKYNLFQEKSIFPKIKSEAHRTVQEVDFYQQSQSQYASPYQYEHDDRSYSFVDDRQYQNQQYSYMHNEGYQNMFDQQQYYYSYNEEYQRLLSQQGNAETAQQFQGPQRRQKKKGGRKNPYRDRYYYRY